MAKHSVKAGLLVSVNDAEAEVLACVAEAADIIADRSIAPEVDAQFDRLGPAFAAAFPKKPGSPFDRFLDIFSDPNHPRLGFDLQVAPPDGSGEGAS